MKLSFKSFVVLAVAGSALFSISSCKKSDSDSPAVSTGTLMLHIHTNLDTNEVDSLGYPYAGTDKRKVSVTEAEFYISKITLVKTDNSVYTIPDTILLKTIENEEYMAGKVPAGNYKTITFTIGLDSAANKKTPSSRASDPLNTASMWFSGTAQPDGYAFLNFQGKIDTSASANATVAQMQPFSYKIGTNANLKTVTLPEQAFTVTPNQAETIHLVADYYKLFSGITINKAANLTVGSKADNAGVTAAKIAANIPSMFRYEQ